LDDRFAPEGGKAEDGKEEEEEEEGTLAALLPSSRGWFEGRPVERW
jgi:hypothetical protein